MPHSLFELNEMSREQLTDVASELAIKVTKKMSMEDIAFSILDAQAQAESVKPAEKPKAKRGRPRKDAAKPAEPVAKAPEAPRKPAAETSETPAAEKKPAGTPRKKPAKNRKADSAADTETDSEPEKT